MIIEIYLYYLYMYYGNLKENLFICVLYVFGKFKKFVYFNIFLEGMD